MKFRDWQHMNKQAKSELVPELRFPEFQNTGEWKKENLGSLLDYLQPTKYLVSSTAYKDTYVTPVLTAGKTFILGYTNETGGIYSDNLPVIIFDDFTTSSKYVDFPFKAKSSAMKILVAKNNNNIKFAYEIMQNLQYAIGAHERHWISIFSKLKVPVPKDIKEQQKIADCLSSLDELIAAHTQKHEALQAYKKGLMQNLFPSEGKTVPTLRFPEFEGTVEWSKTMLINVADKNIKWSFIGGPFGSNLKSSDYTPNGVRVIQLQNIGDAEFNNGYQIFTSEEKANELLSNNIYPGDIILSKMGDPVGRACLIPDFHSRYVMCSDGIRIVVDRKCFSKYFIYTLINSSQFRALVEKKSTGSTRKRIGLSDLKKLPLVIPKLKEQLKIANCLSSVDDLITAQSQRIEELKKYKKGLIQRLFPIMDEVSE